MAATYLLYLVTATDACGTNTLTCSKLDTTNGCGRTRTITWVAVDDCNQTNTCTQVVTWTEDTTLPVFTPPPFATCSLTNFLACNVDESTIPHCLVSVQATDNCSTPHVGCKLVQTTNLCPGSAVDGVRTRIVTYEADDACKNTNFCAQVFIWSVDHTAPIFTKCPANANLGCNPATIPDCDLTPPTWRRRIIAVCRSSPVSGRMRPMVAPDADNRLYGDRRLRQHQDLHSGSHLDCRFDPARVNRLSGANTESGRQPGRPDLCQLRGHRHGRLRRDPNSHLRQRDRYQWLRRTRIDLYRHRRLRKTIPAGRSSPGRWILRRS